MSKGVRVFYFPNCMANSLNRHKIGIGRKSDYLNVVRTAGLIVILGIVIVNKVYGKLIK